MYKFVPQGMGWIPDLPDLRDYHVRHESVLSHFAQLKRSAGASRKSVDLRRDEGEHFTPPDDQGSLNCSSICAVLGLVEYFVRRVQGHTFEGSTFYLYKMARKLGRSSGDCGIDLRTTLKALCRFGVPPHDLWHNDPGHFDDIQPDVGLLGSGYALDYRQSCYLKLDASDAQRSQGRDLRHALGSQTLRTLKSFVAAGFPVAFGFPVPRSLTADSRIPYRPKFDSLRGGQAVLAVGYDDEMDTSPKGAILIRNSWGATWGDCGYGWLPYAYVEQQLARDFWTLLRREWIDPSELSLPSVCETEMRAARRANP